MIKSRTTALGIALLLVTFSSVHAKKKHAPEAGSISLADYVSAAEETAKAKAVEQGKTKKEIIAATQKASKSASQKFKKADTDKNGVLSAEEQKSLTKKKPDAKAKKKPDTKAKKKPDAKAKATISLADYVQSAEDAAREKAVKQGKTKEEVVAATQKATHSANKKFKKADADKDGTLNAEEQKSLKKKKK